MISWRPCISSFNSFPSYSLAKLQQNQVLRNLKGLLVGRVWLTVNHSKRSHRCQKWRLHDSTAPYPIRGSNPFSYSHSHSIMTSPSEKSVANSIRRVIRSLCLPSCLLSTSNCPFFCCSYPWVHKYIVCIMLHRKAFRRYTLCRTWDYNIKMCTKSVLTVDC